MLSELRERIERHARPDLGTSVDGLLLSRVESAEPDHSLTEPLFVLLAQGRKRLLLGTHLLEYRAGECLVVTTGVPVSGAFVGSSRDRPALGLGLELRAAEVADLLLRIPPERPGPVRPPSAVTTGAAGPELLDPLLRLLRLLDAPADVPVLAPLIRREILWRLLTGPHGGVVRQIGLADGDLAHINHAIGWLRQNFAEPMSVAELARLTSLSTSAFHRHFRAVTGLSPLQFQKQLRLQEARTLLVTGAGDVAGVGHLVGYESATQFSREYRRQFGAPPGQDAARLRATASATDARRLP